MWWDHRIEPEDTSQEGQCKGRLRTRRTGPRAADEAEDEEEKGDEAEEEMMEEEEGNDGGEEVDGKLNPQLPARGKLTPDLLEGE
jgi:hypothetical protein